MFAIDVTLDEVFAVDGDNNGSERTKIPFCTIKKIVDVYSNVKATDQKMLLNRELVRDKPL